MFIFSLTNTKHFLTECNSSHNARKENPKKSPRVPPNSATNGGKRVDQLFPFHPGCNLCGLEGGDEEIWPENIHEMKHSCRERSRWWHKCTSIIQHFSPSWQNHSSGFWSHLYQPASVSCSLPARFSPVQLPHCLSAAVPPGPKMLRRPNRLDA